MTYRKLHNPEPDGAYVGLLYRDALTGRWVIENRAGHSAPLPDGIADLEAALAFLRGETRAAA
jgi:hypothetical protein